MGELRSGLTLRVALLKETKLFETLFHQCVEVHMCRTFADAYTSCDVVCDRASRSRDPTVHELIDAVLTSTLAGVRGTQYVTMCYSHYSYKFSAGKKVVDSLYMIVQYSLIQSSGQ